MAGEPAYILGLRESTRLDDMNHSQVHLLEGTTLFVAGTWDGPLSVTSCDVQEDRQPLPTASMIHDERD